MKNRFILAALGVKQQLSQQTAVARSVLSQRYAILTFNFKVSAPRVFTLILLTGIAAIILTTFKPQLSEEFNQLSASTTNFEQETEAQSLAFAETLALNENTSEQNAVISPATYEQIMEAGEQRRVTRWLARRYKIAGSASKMLVDAAYSSAKEVSIDPLLILAVMAIESRMNPFAESHVGAQGLMQVMSRVHSEKFANKEGNKSALNPVANIRAGALILKDYLHRGGSVEAALKLYVGAGNKHSDRGYGERVLAEYQRLQSVSQGKTVPAFTTPVTSPEVKSDRSTLQEAEASSAQDKKI
jgi:soluble lytic murein transglycosylase-like protein